MTSSTHTYTAVLIGAPDAPLSVRGGRISLDSGRAPHVQGYLDVAFPAESTLTALDPRLNARVRVTADAVFPTFSQSRTFNLGLRSRPTRHRDAVVSLDLASDEALLDDYRAPTDDRTPRTLETSLRSIVNYVLGKIGATLAVFPANDANMTAYWELENLVTDPRTSSTTGFFSTGGTATLTRVTGLGTIPGSANTAAIRLEKTGTSAGAIAISRVEKATADRMYTAVIGARKNTAGAMTAAARLQFRNAAGAIIQTATGTATALTGSNSNYVTVTALAPKGTVDVAVGVFYLGTINVGEFVYARNWMMVEGAEAVPFFDGGSSLTGYVTTWQGDADASTSLRTPLSPIDARDPESLVWRAGDSALDFLAPLVQSAGYRLVCDEARSWTLRSISYVAPGSLTFADGFDLTDATDTLSREGDDWFDAQATIYLDPYGVKAPRVDYWALSSSPTKTNRVQITAPYPGTGRSQYAVKRAQGRGRVVQAAKVTDWTARAEQPVTVLLNGAPTQTGLTESVEFDLDNDEVSITTRTTDTLPGAIDLLGGTIDTLVGFINDL